MVLEFHILVYHEAGVNTQPLRAETCAELSTPQLNAKSRWRSHTPLSSFLALMLSTALISGCVSVQVTDRTIPPPPSSLRPVTVADVPNTQATHDLAIAALDFDPALSSNQLGLGKPVSLLVAVENKGNRQQSGVVVSAQLVSQDRQQVLMQSQRILNVLAAGDVSVVRFPSSVTALNQRAYTLTIQVQPVPGETDHTNNKRLLEIQLNGGN